MKQNICTRFTLKNARGRQDTDPAVGGNVKYREHCLSEIECKDVLWWLQDSTFLDYIKGGLRLNLVVAVDMTASNGDPASPRSLHFINQRWCRGKITLQRRVIGTAELWFSVCRPEPGSVVLMLPRSFNQRYLLSNQSKYLYKLKGKCDNISGY